MKALCEDHGGALTLRITGKDLPEFYQLTSANQARVRKLLDIFAEMDAAPSYEAALAIGVELSHGEKYASSKRIEALWLDFRKGGDWRTAIDWRLEGRSQSSFPAAFLEHLQQRVDANKRVTEQALKQLRAEWRAGNAIPGYGTWRQWWQKTNPGLTVPARCPGFPDGWSKVNLRRVLDKSKFRRVAQTIGLTAAAAHRPKVYTTRNGLWVGSHIMFDDLEHDFFVNSLAETQAGRPLELFSHDYFSARKIRYGIRVKTLKEDGSANKLTEKMMRMIFAATFFLDGYSPRGTEVVAEHGTAAVRDWMEKLIFDLSGGLVTVKRSGFTGAAAHAGQYEGIRRGNPRHKAGLESSNNLSHNALASIPGQTGHSLATRPEGLHALLAHNASLLAAAQQMPPATARLLQYDLLTTEQLMDVLSYYYSYIEHETDHDLEGWEECGHIVQELELLGHWINQNDLLALRDNKPAHYEAALALLATGQAQTRPRKMSRREVWDPGASELIKIPGYGVCEILGDDLSEERTVRNHMFEFEDAEVGPGIHRYAGFVETIDGNTIELKEGEKFQAFVNPFAPEHLFVRDARGRYIGFATRDLRPCRGDYARVNRSFGAAAKTEAAALAPLRARQISAVKEREARAAHNAALMSEEPSRQAELAARADAALAQANKEYEPNHNTADDSY